MNGDAGWEVNLTVEAARAKAKQAIFEGVRELFEIEIKTAAIEDSPYLTGTNRRSIDTEVEQTPEGVHAQIFTQSGYGGYLELGTWKMKAQPYLYPAFNKYVSNLIELVGKRIKSIAPGMFSIKGG